jgi:hypothetical protein
MEVTKLALGKPKLSTKTPDDAETNALLVDGVHDSLISAFRSPSKSSERFIVARVGVDEIVTREGGASFARISIRHLEFTDEEHLLEAYTDRTGHPTLPGDDAPNQLDGLRSGGEKAAADAAFDEAAPAK